MGADGDGRTAPGGFQRPGPTQARLSDSRLLRALSRLFHRLAQSRPFVYLLVEATRMTMMTTTMMTTTMIMTMMNDDGDEDD